MANLLPPSLSTVRLVNLDPSLVLLSLSGIWPHSFPRLALKLCMLRRRRRPLMAKSAEKFRRLWSWSSISHSPINSAAATNPRDYTPETKESLLSHLEY